MVDDPNDPQEFQDNSGGGRRSPGGGGGGMLNLLPLLFTLFRKPGGWLLIVLLAAGYFLLNQQGCGSMLSQTDLSQFAKGGILDKNEFAKASVYEGLTEDDIRNPLPEFVSLGKFAPPRQNQGRQGSCVAWSSAYAAQTILMSASKGESPDQLAFSPSYMYNQIGLDDCQGSYIIRAMNLMQQKGGVPFNSFPYDETNCSRNPDASLDGMAAANRIHGFNRLTESSDPGGINIRAVKEHLASGAPVVIGMMVGGSFMQEMLGQQVWQPTQSDYNQMGFGGHAMCVIGYDDRLAGGAFQIMNSWGPEWGENGIAWVRYADFKEFVREAYGLDPLPKQGAALNQPFDCEIGLVRVDEKAKPVDYISLDPSSSNVFSSSTISKGTRFKVEVKNSTECYVYVFGQETDGSSYTLFPYPLASDPTKTAYTPYCGITGYRLFPRRQSMMADSVGNRDFIAVVVSKTELPWYQVNQTISSNKGNYAQAVQQALSQYEVGRLSVSRSDKGNMRFTAPAGDKGVAYAIIEINKQ
jgi:C1A family cysteine protease